MPGPKFYEVVGIITTLTCAAAGGAVLVAEVLRFVAWSLR